jgi:hypothetical protein
VTIWDASGNDTVDASSASGGWEIVLPSAQLSSLSIEKVGYAIPLADINLPSPRSLAWLVGDIENAVGSASRIKSLAPTSTTS